MILSHPRRVYHGAVVGQTTTASTAKTYTGLCLTNPAASGVNLVVTNVGASFLVAFGAASAIGLMAGSSTTAVTQSAAITPYSLFAGAVANQGLLASSATLPVTPVIIRILQAGLTGAITTIPTTQDNYWIQEGELVVPPTGFVCIYTSTASGTNGGALSFTWMEVPQA